LLERGHPYRKKEGIVSDYTRNQVAKERYDHLQHRLARDSDLYCLSGQESNTAPVKCVDPWRLVEGTPQSCPPPAADDEIDPLLQDPMKMSNQGKAVLT
jgi:hypothetical protein